ncbi:aldehyde dehydrogenase family protein [Pseudomonas sp. NPDC096917]|uniref:aldehyde dehydrogenase family protein n=1 Tax=Pseudomonas sp. NPDC096917 TaxID=3364483 RepID=UPI00383ADE61
MVVGELAEEAQMAPTLVDRVSSKMDIYDEETFRPVTNEVRVKGAEQALAVATIRRSACRQPSSVAMSA